MAKGRSGPDMSSLLVSGVIVLLTHFHLSGLLRSLPELWTLWDGLSHVVIVSLMLCWEVGIILGSYDSSCICICYDESR